MNCFHLTRSVLQRGDNVGGWSVGCVRRMRRRGESLGWRVGQLQLGMGIFRQWSGAVKGGPAVVRGSFVVADRWCEGLRGSGSGLRRNVNGFDEKMSLFGSNYPIGDKHAACGVRLTSNRWVQKLRKSVRG